jgi:hypothetical protein
MQFLGMQGGEMVVMSGWLYAVVSRLTHGTITRLGRNAFACASIGKLLVIRPGALDWKPYD